MVIVINRNTTCCFNGHRRIPPSERPALEKRLEVEIEHLIHQGVRYFGAGGALGFDTMAALAVLRLRTLHPHIRLILVLPCEDQAKSWGEAGKKIYDLILHDADKVVYVSRKYTPDCMYKRNRHLVNHSGVCLCYLTNPKSGTGYTVGYAKQKGLRVINLAEHFHPNPTFSPIITPK